MDLSLIAEKLDLIINILVFLVLGSALNFGSLLFRHYRK